ncbi:MAG: hypothetical protein FWG58_00580 [Methanomassiliicoccaceae archaeon]|nr:hypothetical protein [Methanomassiliicoccaceae archaeon]
MIEFTLSRVCLSVCGLLLLASVIVPVTGMYDRQAIETESNMSGGMASLVSTFYYSEMRELTISMSDILPSASSYAEMNGHMITLTTERGTYRSGTDVTMVTENGDVFRYHDVIRMSRSGDTVRIERLE